ncbi:hypothetical protein C1H46_014145 [Malus baccata]|uniref:MADS-box domain-containing protein n=1 Tax=Malus baccata TaxID=106549 RepID=A0A540MN49_MALBA|nr:hypothetical protein C1H46_014145 [Malus baccata]
MMREKIKIRKIDYLPARQVTFSKRRRGDLKKAGELSILYGFYGRRLEGSTLIVESTGC